MTTNYYLIAAIVLATIVIYQLLLSSLTKLSKQKTIKLNNELSMLLDKPSDERVKYLRSKGYFDDGQSQVDHCMTKRNGKSKRTYSFLSDNAYEKSLAIKQGIKDGTVYPHTSYLEGEYCNCIRYHDTNSSRMKRLVDYIKTERLLCYSVGNLDETIIENLNGDRLVKMKCDIGEFYSVENNFGKRRDIQLYKTTNSDGVSWIKKHGELDKENSQFNILIEAMSGDYFMTYFKL